MQLLAFGGCADRARRRAHLGEAGDRGVVYEDVNDPRGIAVLTVARTSETLRRTGAAARSTRARARR